MSRRRYHNDRFDIDDLPKWVINEKTDMTLFGYQTNGYPGLTKRNGISYGYGSLQHQAQQEQVLIAPIIQEYGIKVRSKTFNLSGLAIYERYDGGVPNDPNKKKFIVTVEVAPDYHQNRTEFYRRLEANGGSRHDYYDDGYNTFCTKVIVMSQHDTLTDAKKRVEGLIEKHIKKLIDEKKQEDAKSITDVIGKPCTTRCFINSYVNRQYKSSPGPQLHIGDFVVSTNRQYRGWIWMIEQEDVRRQSPLRIVPVFCGLEQIDFSKRRICVGGSEIVPVDTIQVGIAFQNLKNVVEKMMKAKSGNYATVTATTPE